MDGVISLALNSETALLAAFIGFFAALAGAIVGALGRIFTFWYTSRRIATFNIIELMASPVVVKARRVVDGGLNERAVATLEELLPTLKPRDAEDSQLSDAFSDLINFFEILYAYRSWRYLKRKAVRQVMGQRISYWYVNIYERFKDDRDSDWVFAIEKIGKLRGLCDRESLLVYRNRRASRVKLAETSKVGLK